MSDEFLDELPEKPRALRAEAAEYEKLIDKIIAADGKWVSLRQLASSSAKSFQTAMESKANRRRIFIETDKRADSESAFTVYARLVKQEPLHG
jgi:hypothetical protein